MIKHEKKEIIFLVLILVAGVFLRIYNLSENPKGFFCDEASIGYNAYLLLKTGRDEYGQKLPAFFRAFGEYKGSILIYSTIPSIALFGLSEFAVRITSAIYGSLTILIIYLLSKKLFSGTVGILSAFFLAISPWHIHLSRMGMDIVAFLFFLCVSIYLFLKGQERDAFLYLSFFSFAITFYTYYVAYLVVPLFLLFLVIIFKLWQRPKILFLGLTIFSLISTPFLLHLFSGKGFTRLRQTWLFSSEIVPYEIVKKIVKLYFSHFSLNFLFKYGDSDFPGQFITRHSIKGIGELYWFQLPLLLISIFYLWKNKKEKNSLLMFFWFFIYPFGTIFTNAPGPQATRSIIGVIPFQIVSAIGLQKLSLFLNKNLKVKIIFLILTIIVFSLSFLFFLIRHQEYPLHSSDYWGWQYGPREIIRYFKEVEGNYDELIMSSNFNAGEIFFKFYYPEGCIKCKIGNITNYNPTKKQLFALSPDEIKNFNFKTQKTVYYPNGETAFLIGEIIK